MEEENKTEVAQPEQLQTQQSIMTAPKQLVRKFELEVFEEDLDTPSGWKKVRYDKPLIVEVTSPKELQDKLALYKDCGQMAKVVREIDPPTKEQIAAAQQQATLAVQQQMQSPIVQAAPQQVVIQQPILQAAPQPIQARKPKYYKVGDIEIKDDNGKIYQKQWMKLTNAEASNFRLVSDKNNAIANMNGKHLEMKKWVLVQNSEEDESTQLEESMNS